jgi:hypothetical protein
MKHAYAKRTLARLVTIAGAYVALQIPRAVHADTITPPSVPSDLVVSSEYRPYLVGHAVGTQNYVCLPKAGGGFEWVQYGPQATLFDDDGTQIATHFLSPNPDEDDTYRASWQHSRDTSAVWAKQVKIYKESDYVEDGAVPWLLLQVVGQSRGVKGGRRLTDTAFIQRVHTSGGTAPQTGCADAENVGAKALVPYSTDYYFYKARGRQK